MRNKKLMVFAVLVVALGGLFYLVNAIEGGNINNVKETVVKTQDYSEEDIKAAMSVVKKTFKREFEGSTLTDLWNEGSLDKATTQGWANQYNAGEAIVLFSNFDVDASGGDGSFNPNSTYTSWQWILVRNSSKDSWILKTWGY